MEQRSGRSLSRNTRDANLRAPSVFKDLTIPPPILKSSTVGIIKKRSQRSGYQSASSKSPIALRNKAESNPSQPFTFRKSQGIPSLQSNTFPINQTQSIFFVFFPFL